MAARRQETGAKLRYLDVDDDGCSSLDELDSRSPRAASKLVAVAHVSNVLGTINPVAEIAARANAAGALVARRRLAGGAADAVDVAEIGADFYAWTGHKALGPTGIGVLHGRRDLLEAMRPFIGGRRT